MQKTVDDVIEVLKDLPPERVEEVYDFALFLNSRCKSQSDFSDEWTEEDMRDATIASLRYADSLEAEDEARFNPARL